MEKIKTNYLIAWGIAVAVFVGVALLIPQEIGGWSKNEGSFWAAFVMILLVFMGQLGCSEYVFRKASPQQRFLRLPVIYVSYIALLVIWIVEIICVVIPMTKNWLGFALGFIILACYGIAVVLALSAAETIAKTEQKLKEDTRFMCSLRAEADLLQKKVRNPDISVHVKKISEAIRYSSLRSNAALEQLEGRLYVAFTAFSEAAGAENESLSKEKAEAFLLLLEERNSKCRLLK